MREKSDEVRRISGFSIYYVAMINTTDGNREKSVDDRSRYLRYMMTTSRNPELTAIYQ